jgi:hypothetical protein
VCVVTVKSRPGEKVEMRKHNEVRVKEGEADGEGKEGARGEKERDSEENEENGAEVIRQRLKAVQES